MLSRLFIAVLWLPAGKWLTSWLSFVMFYCGFVIFPYGILGQVWYLIVSIPDLCRLSYINYSVSSRILAEIIKVVTTPNITLQFLPLQKNNPKRNSNSLSAYWNSNWLSIFLDTFVVAVSEKGHFLLFLEYIMAKTTQF